MASYDGDRDDIPEPLKNLNTSTKHFDSVDCLFRNLESNLVKIIHQYEKGVIFGCVAWLTSEPILKALARCENVQIVVQKEDFLRPDLHTVKDKSWAKYLRRLYDALKFDIDRYTMRDPINYLSVCGSPNCEPVRCIGEHNAERKPAFPRAHNKFMVFCEPPVRFMCVEENGLGKKFNIERLTYAPTTVWTGSFNFTKNATYSFENAIVLRDKSGDNPVLNAYLNEHHQILGLSEVLDWRTPWMLPEYKIGT